MKRLCLILAYLFLFSQTAFAMPLLVGQKVVYRGTITGLRISAVDGTAFIDNLPYTYSSDFSVGVDGWSAVTGAVTGNIDGIGGQDNTLRFTCNTTNESHYVSRASVFTIGKKYQVDFKYYIPSGQSNIDGLRLPANYWEVTSDLTTLDSWTTVSKTFTATTNTSIRIYFLDGNDTTFQDAGGDDVFYIKDITISEITPYMDGNHQIEIYDASNRMLRGVLKAAGSGVTTSTVYTADFSAGVDGWFANWATGYVAGSLVWDTDHAVLTVAGNASLPNRPRLSKTLSMTVGALQFLEMDYSVVSGSPIITTESIGGAVTSLTTTLSGTDTYITSKQTCAGTLYNTLFLYFNGRDYDFVLNINAVRVKAVTAPSSSGATITTLKNGDVYNWSYKNSSFSFNSASYYVIIRAIR